MRLPARIAATTASSAAVPDDAHSTVSTSSRVTRSISACGPAPHRSRWAAAPVGSCARSVSQAASVAITTARGR